MPEDKTEQQQQSPPTPEKIWKFSVISDLNGSYGSKTYSQDVAAAVKFITNESTEIDFSISTGDMVAGQKSHLDYLGMWKAFHSNVTRKLTASKIPLYPSPGNHDASIGRATERKHYLNSWSGENIPSIHPGFNLVKGVEQNYPFSYAFTLGPALFIALDNTSINTFSDRTIVWLEDVLEKKKDLPNKFIYGHVPLLPFALGRANDYNARGDSGFLNHMEELFERYEVSVFFSGHSHVYYPGKRLGKTQYISVPLLGGGPRRLLTKTRNEPRSEHGFLTVTYSESGELKIHSIASDNYSVIEDQELPSSIDIPLKDYSDCRGCKNFPSSMFLDKSKRSVYYRRDL
ncbi:MAG: metallophosphoesterase family protein [Bdellovibrionales bacterium]